LAHARKEQKHNSPGKRHPECEEDDDRLNQQHFGRPGDADFQRVDYAFSVMLRFCIYWLSSFLPQLLRTTSQDDVMASLFENEVKDWDQGAL